MCNKYLLKDICTITAGQSPESKYYNYDKNGLPFFQGKADFGDLYPNIRVYCSNPKKIAEQNDILLSIRAPVGATNLAPCKVCIGRGLTAIQPSENVNYKYLLYFFKFYESKLQEKGTGTTFKAINQNVIKNILVPLPDIIEQEKIVVRIEELFSQLDSGVETLKKIKQQLAVYRQAVLKEAFDTLSQEYANLGDIIEKPKYGTSKKCEYTKHNKAVYRIPNIDYEKGIINKEDLKYADFSDKELTTIDLRENDLLIIRSNGSVSLVGRTAIVEQNDADATFAGYLMRLRLKNPTRTNAKLLYYYLESSKAREYIERVAKSTSGVNNINSEEIKKLSVPICINENKKEKTLFEIESKISICDNICITVDKVLKKAETFKQCILIKAFGGEIQ